MAKRLPEAYEQLLDTMARLEQHYRDMQDIEFTVEEGHLYMLQTRSAKRTAAAAIKAAVDMTAEGLISREEAIARIDPQQLDQLLHPMLDPNADFEVAARGLNASPGAASGAIVLDADTAEERGKAGEAVILVGWETTPDDIHGMIQARGVLTAHGGMTSHAAVVARGMGKPCVAGCEGLDIDSAAKTITLGGRLLHEGDTITIDGGTGRVIVGEVDLVPPRINEDFETILEWADEVRRLAGVGERRQPRGRREGARVRRPGRRPLPHRAHVLRRGPAAGRPGDDPGLRRAGPPGRARPAPAVPAVGLRRDLRVDGRASRSSSGSSTRRCTSSCRRSKRRRTSGCGSRIKTLHESNPMLGTRGCRLGIQWPEIYEMQVRAIARAARAVHERTGDEPLVEIMHPLVAFKEELHRLRELTERVMEEEAPEIEYQCGTMIELPRAALRADEIAEYADFFSFGTNDLTQTTIGMSRDDAEGKFLTFYLEDGVIEQNPFETIDQSGVGDLMRIAVERGRSVKPDITLGICGEHGGEPKSVEFCHGLGLDYVSCSPYRVPLARLAAAQAVLKEAHRAEYVAAGG